jgi:hypothetical protein
MKSRTPIRLAPPLAFGEPPDSLRTSLGQGENPERATEGSESKGPDKDTLWMLTLAPTIWTAHLMLCYLTAAIWCARFADPGGPLGSVRSAIGWYTAIALIGIAIVGWEGFRRHRHGTETIPHDFDSPEERHRFLGFATLLLSGLSAVATIYVALAAVFCDTCH